MRVRISPVCAYPDPIDTPVLRVRIAALILAGLGVACPRDNTCRTDDDCSTPNTRCDAVSAQCICTADSACGADEFCNSVGICQRDFGCFSNDDCPLADTYCEIGSARCIAGPGLQLGSPCVGSVQCPYGAVCLSGKCAPGCFGHGDCVLGQLCVDGQCRVADGRCAASDFCDYGSACVDGRCQVDERGLYCQECPPITPEDPSPCGPPGSLCLVNSYGAGPDLFCGVTCANGESCPNGYVCSDVATLTDRDCESDADCAPGRSCRIGEGRLSGFCSCAADADCPPDTCDGSRKVCRKSGTPCERAGAACAPIACVDGACVVGKACVPNEGLDCELLDRSRR